MVFCATIIKHLKGLLKREPFFDHIIIEARIQTNWNYFMSITTNQQSAGPEVKLKIAVQKSGRLHDDSIRLPKECGIDISNGVNKLKSEASNFPLQVFFRDDDIPQYVEDAVADLGFVGENVVYEKTKSRCGWKTRFRQMPSFDRSKKRRWLHRRFISSA